MRPVPNVVLQSRTILRSTHQGSIPFLSGGSMKDSRSFWILSVCSLFLLFMTPPAYRYTDPNTISLISHTLPPLLITAAAGFTFLLNRVLDVFSGLSRLLRR